MSMARQEGTREPMCKFISGLVFFISIITRQVSLFFHNPDQIRDGPQRPDHVREGLGLPTGEARTSFLFNHHQHHQLRYHRHYYCHHHHCCWPYHDHHDHHDHHDLQARVPDQLNVRRRGKMERWQCLRRFQVNLFSMILNLQGTMIISL